MTNNFKFSAYALSIVLTGFLAGCITYAKARGTVVEAAFIRPTEEIVILWDLGNFSNVSVRTILLKDQTFSKRFEMCMNDYFAKTFAKNGYNTKSIKMQPAAFDTKGSNARFVLVLNNTEALWSRDTPDSVLLNVYGTLYEQGSGKKLWSVKHYMDTRADNNGNAALQLVRALASDGFLNVKLEEVVDSDGILSPSFKKVSGCPL